MKCSKQQAGDFFLIDVKIYLYNSFTIYNLNNFK